MTIFVAIAAGLGVRVFGLSRLQLGLEGGTALVLVVIGALELLALGVVVRGLRRRGQTLRSLGLTKRAPAWTLIVAAIGAVLYAASTIASPYLDVRHHWLELNSLKALGALVGVIAGFVEETIFRGLLISRLDARGYSTSRQIVVSGLVFGAAHLLYGPGAIFATVLGLFAAWLYIKAGRSLMPPIVCHSLVNMLVEPWLIMSVLRRI